MTLDILAIGNDILKQVKNEKILGEGDIIFRCIGKYEGINPKDILEILNFLVKQERLEELSSDKISRKYYKIYEAEWDWPRNAEEENPPFY